ncbi:MAG: ATP-dependent Clp protease ATP-binding subunit [Deltaproteobacteria bacterium]|nr:ATP-dependent Clp protease ATP-binding subunit [Deltaproteobacteria bacterium]
MMIDFTVGVFYENHDGDDEWIALVPGKYPCNLYDVSAAKMPERMIERLRDALRRAAPGEQELFQLPLGTELVRVPVDVKSKGGHVHGQMPIIVEPRWVSDGEQRLFCYHPNRRDMWFVTDDRSEIATLGLLLAREHWSDIEDESDLEPLLCNGKERLVTVAFSAEPQSLIDLLPSRKKDPRAGAAAPRPDRVLYQLGVDETQRMAQGTLRVGVPRSPYRERLAYLMSGARPRSAAVVGPPGAGKTMLIHQWIADRLAEDGHPIHKNLDKCHHVWRISGKRLIAGMSHLGEWEERCLAVLDEARRRKGILWIEDLHLFGRLGQSRQSERSFADFFRGPVRRGDLAIIAEMTPEQLARLERDAPGLAEALSRVSVPAASPGETAQLLLHEIRALEVRLKTIEVHPFVPRTALELGAALFPWRARPGVAIEIVRRVAELAAQQSPDGTRRPVTPNDVLDYLARTTGLAPALITLEQPLDPQQVEQAFAARVIGQPTATRAAADVIVKVRAGLADAGRPVSVMLFTGPTGTGKTELATAIAEYLYGDPSRFVRIDMGEMSGPDAVSRLIGDRWNPDGLLTSRVRAQPFCVVLLDEIEKAHPQVLHLLLQLFDEGRLTDAAGEVASFASAVVIMTSNLGSKNAAPIGFGDARDRILADVAKAVRDFFPIELFNRIDQVVPFEPLTHEVAAKVVDKELSKLLGRRGLRERNTFVYAGAAVRRRAVEDAFDPRYGARTVKRWLEDHVAGSLTDLLAGAPPARLRIIRLAENAGRIEASLEPMTERAAEPGTYILAGALDLATAGLEPAIAKALTSLERIAQSPHLRRAKEEATGELRYYLDELETRVAALHQLFGRDPHDDDDPTERRRGGPTRPPASRDALIEGIAETLLVERALPRLLDPDAHAATIVLSRVGQKASTGGVYIAAHVLGQPAWLDDAAITDGKTIRKVDNVSVSPLVEDMALVLRGLFVRDALAGEHGTWFLRAAGSEPDIVRVEVRAGAPHTAEETLRAHVAARRELERVLDKGGALPPNPDALLPVARTITYRPSLRAGEPMTVEIEDFSTGWVDKGLYRDVPTAVRRAWCLAWSRS